MGFLAQGILSTECFNLQCFISYNYPTHGSGHLAFCDLNVTFSSPPVPCNHRSSSINFS